MTLHPDFPVVESHYQMTKEWSLTLPCKFNRRFEDESLVIWRTGFTIWISVWNNDYNETLEERYKGIIDASSPEAYDKETERGDGIIRYAYRLAEESDDERLSAFYCFVIGKFGHVQMAIYVDNEEDISMARSIWKSVTETQTTG